MPAVYGPYSDEYGTFVSGIAPVIDPVSREVLLLIAIDIEAHLWKEQLLVIRLQVLAGVLTLCVFIGLAAGGLFWRSRQGNAAPRWARHLETVSVIGLGLLLTAGGTLLVHEDEQLQRNQVFDEISTLKMESIFSGFREARTGLSAIGRFVASSNGVDAQEFSGFTKPMSDHTTVRNYIWLDLNASELPRIRFNSATSGSEDKPDLDFGEGSPLAHAAQTALATGLHTVAIQRAPGGGLFDQGLWVFFPIQPVNAENNLQSLAGARIIPSDVVLQKTASPPSHFDQIEFSLYHLEEDGSRDPSTLPILDLMETSANRRALIIRQILTFARGDSGERKATDLALLLTEIAKVIRQTLPKSICLELDLAERIPPVLANPTGIEQVMLNLCINARDAMPEGGEIKVGLRPVQIDAATTALNTDAHPGEYVEISVKDTGTGIDAALLDKIFDPFFTTKGQDKGTGLGLSVLQGIVRAHGGFVRVQSQPASGTLFRVFLPMECALEEEQISPPTPVQSAAKGGTVLVVDDEDAIRKVVGALLESNGYRVFPASSGSAALEIWSSRSEEIDMILTDLSMPGIDGAVLIQKLSAAGCRKPVLVMTGLLPQMMTKREGSLTGADGILSKPVQAEVLLSEIARLMGRA